MSFQESFAPYSELLKSLPGVDWSDIYFQRTTGKGIFYEDGKIEEVSSGSSGGCSASFQIGARTALASVSGVEKGAARQALSEVCRIASITPPKSPALDFPFSRQSVDFPEDVQFLRDMDVMLRNECSLIRQVTLSWSAGVNEFGVVNPEAIRSGRFERNSFRVHVLVESGGRVESGSSSFSLTGTSDEFFKALNAEKVARKALKYALTALEAVACPTGPMPVLLSDSAGGTMIHEACGHGMEADLVFEEKSHFASKKGQMVAAECVSIVDDATLPWLNGSYEFDDEGTPASRTVLIENGDLKNYLTDRRCSRLYNLPLTGNGRRMSFASSAMPRMSNTCVLCGNDDQDEMIQSIPRGLFVERMGGGEVNATTGEFVFEVSRGRLIEDGKITRPVKGASLIGSGIKALMGIRAVGKRLRMLPGMCEKRGQSVRVSDGQPSLLIDGLVVGGTVTEDENG